MLHLDAESHRPHHVRAGLLAQSDGAKPLQQLLVSVENTGGQFADAETRRIAHALCAVGSEGQEVGQDARAHARIPHLVGADHVDVVARRILVKRGDRAILPAAFEMLLRPRGELRAPRLHRLASPQRLQSRNEREERLLHAVDERQAENRLLAPAALMAGVLVEEIVDVLGVIAHELQFPLQGIRLQVRPEVVALLYRDDADFHDSTISRALTTRAGLPATMTNGGTSFVTTARAATMAPSPTVTPGRMVA